MGAIFKKTVTRPIPAGAEIFTKSGERFAKWKAANGKPKTATIIAGKDGQERIRTIANTWTAKYRDGEGIVREVSTGCRDKQAAQAKLAELVSRSEKVRSKILSPAESEIADHQITPLETHIGAYIEYMRSRGKNADRIKTTETRLKESAGACGFRLLSDLRADPLRKFLDEQAEAGRSASVVNGYAAVWTAFGYWCTGKRMHGKRSSMNGDKRLTMNPFAGIGLLDPKSDRRRIARALSEDEIRKLIKTARERPLNEALTIRRGVNKGKLLARIGDKVRARLERTGRERALIYKLAILTGLRLREIRTLRIRELELETDPAFLTLRMENEKNREGSQVVLRSDLAADLRNWLATRLAEHQAKAEAAGEAKPDALPDSLLVFDVPAGLLRIFNRDLKKAGIAKEDIHKRRVHVHGLRHTFGTHLSKTGASPRTAQAAMRHSDISLTMNVYTDPRLLDVAGAVERLPSIPLDDAAGIGSEPAAQALAATGTDQATPKRVAPNVAPTSRKSLQILAYSRKSGGKKTGDRKTKKAQENQCFPGFSEVEPKRFELSTSALRTQERTIQNPSDLPSETDSENTRCTNGCTKNEDETQAEPLDSRVQAILSRLSDDERAAMLEALTRGK